MNKFLNHPRPYQTPTSLLCGCWDLGCSELYKSRFHLQSLNIHKQDPLILTHEMSYMFQMISVERVIEYTDLVKEASWELEYRPPPFWPNMGRIYFYNVNFRHTSDGPLVLWNVYPKFYPGQKVSLSHLPFKNLAKDLAPHLLLTSLAVCQGDCFLLMDAD